MTNKESLECGFRETTFRTLNSIQKQHIEWATQCGLARAHKEVKIKKHFVAAGIRAQVSTATTWNSHH